LHRLRIAGLIVFAALLPDVDFLIGFLMGEPNRFHGGPTHSLGAAVVAGFVLGVLAGRRRFRVGLLCFLAYASHVILDSLTRDGRPPLGVPMFWPLTDHYFNFPLIAGIRHGMDGVTVDGFLGEVFSTANLRALAVEVGIGSVLILGSLGIGELWGRDRSRGGDRSQPASPRRDG
jgi:inner membrane protein